MEIFTLMDELEEYCSYFPDYHIEAVENLLEQLTKQEVDERELQEKSIRVMEYADAHYGLADYTDGLREALRQLAL